MESATPDLPFRVQTHRGCDMDETSSHVPSWDALKGQGRSDQDPWRLGEAGDAQRRLIHRDGGRGSEEIELRGSRRGEEDDRREARQHP